MARVVKFIPKFIKKNCNVINIGSRHYLLQKFSFTIKINKYAHKAQSHTAMFESLEVVEIAKLEKK